MALLLVLSNLFFFLPSDSVVLASDRLLRRRVHFCPDFEVVSFDDVDLVRGLPGKGDVFKNLQNK